MEQQGDVVIPMVGDLAELTQRLANGCKLAGDPHVSNGSRGSEPSSTGQPVSTKTQLSSPNPASDSSGNKLFLLPPSYFSDIESVDFASLSHVPESGDFALRSRSQAQHSFAINSLYSLASGELVPAGAAGGVHYSGSCLSSTSNVQLPGDDGPGSGELVGFLSMGGQAQQGQQQGHQGQQQNQLRRADAGHGVAQAQQYSAPLPHPLQPSQTGARRNQGYRKLFQQVCTQRYLCACVTNNLTHDEPTPFGAQTFAYPHACILARARALTHAHTHTHTYTHTRTQTHTSTCT